MEDYESTKGLFVLEPLDWPNSRDGDVAYMRKADQKDYLVFELQQYRERGRTELCYITDHNLNIQLIRVVSFIYDKPWNAPDKNVTIAVKILVLEGDTVKVYDRYREIDDPEFAKLAVSLKLLFKSATKSLAK